MPSLVLRCKVAILGDSKVGKTALTTAFHKGRQFQKNYVMTLGVDFAVKSVKLSEASKEFVKDSASASAAAAAASSAASQSASQGSTDAVAELYLFDTSGATIYSTLRQRYWEGASFVLLCFDLTQRSSFTALSKWLEEAKKALKTSPTQPLKGALVACKCDMAEYATVKHDEAQSFAATNGLQYFQTSALSGKDVDAPFHYLAQSYHQQYEASLKSFAGLGGSGAPLGVGAGHVAADEHDDDDL